MQYIFIYFYLKGDSGGPLLVKGTYGQLDVIGARLCSHCVYQT